MGDLYTIFIILYTKLIRLAAFFKPKAALWVKGRIGLWDKMEKELMPGKKRLWFHCASLGEFEQGRPLIEACRMQHPDYEILLTFFSPSGYEIRKNYEGADHVFYLPADTPENVKRFLDLSQPSAAFFIKYEFWYNYLQGLDKRNIPVFFVSAIFRPGQHFFHAYGTWFRGHLQRITHFFVQNEASLKLLASVGISHATVSGDTRFDRVYSIAAQAKEFPLIGQFRADDALFLVGSSWPEDEKIVKSLVDKNLPGMKFIFAPHEVDPARIQGMLEKMDKTTLRYSQIGKDTRPEDHRSLVIDSIGILSNLYQYASYAFIGGGYGRGIHNILEAATFGMPIFFGPNYLKFQEACDLIDRGGAFAVADAAELIKKVEQLREDPILHHQVASIAKAYVNEKRGASAVIINKIKTYL